MIVFSSSGGFWNKRSGLEKALLVCLGVCGTVMVAGGSFYAAQQRNSGFLFSFTVGPQIPMNSHLIRIEKHKLGA